MRFLDDHGATVLTYGGLKVWDADGKSLPSRFDAADTGLRLLVDERGARYPLTIDPIAQQAYLKAGNTGAGDQFGVSVAISEDTVVVGAMSEDSSTTGVNSTPNESATDSGAAYVFVRSGTTWTQQAYLKASNTGAGDLFGYSVAVSGDTVVIGARAEDSSTTGVNSPPNNGFTDSGAAYVFVRSGTTWTQQAYLKASNTGAGDLFGYSVAVSGDTVVIGAREEDSSTTGVNSTPNNGGSNSGAAYVFTRSGTTWTQQAYVKASNTGANDYFGYSVQVAGDTVVIGAIQEDSNTTGVNSTPNEGSYDSGAAYVFTRSGTAWAQQAYLKASNTGVGDYFGGAVSLSGDTVVVGAREEDSSSTGVNSTPNEGAANSGAAYVFTRSGTTWTQQAYLKASNAGAGDLFGYSVAVSSDTVVVGAYLEDSNTVGVNGAPDELAADSGAAYVFTRSGLAWTRQAYLKASNTGAGDNFGASVDVSGDTVVVGAYMEASSTTGVNSTPNELASIAGAAYVFTGLGPNTVPAALPSGCVAWWRGEDNFLDSVGTHHGTGKNGAAFASGKVGQSMSFDGTDDSIEVPSSGELNLVSGQGWTMEGWVNPETSNQFIAHKGSQLSGQAPYWGVYVSDGLLRFEVCPGSGWDTLISSAGMVTGQWQHFAVVADKMGGPISGYHLYLDGTDAGVSFSHDGTSSGTVNVTEPLRIGVVNNSGTMGAYAKGQMDELAIYNRALSPTEIAAIHAAGSAGKVGVAPTITTSSPLPPGIVGSPYSQSLAATGGTAPYTWSVASGQLPSGLALASDGTISGTPTTAGTTTFTVRVTGSDTGTATKEVTVAIIAPAALPSGCVAWWRGEDNFLDSVGPHHGTGMAGVTFAAGKVAQAMSFDGTNDTVQVPSSPTLNLVSGQGWTMEGWIKPNVLTDQWIAHKGGSANGTTVPYWGVMLRNDSPAGQLGFEMCPGSGADQYDFSKSATPVTVGVWQHIAVVVDNMGGTVGGIHYYINGVSAGSTDMRDTATLGTVNTTEPLVIGSYRGTAQFFNGLIDELSIYNRALTPAEISAIHTAGSAGKVGDVGVAPTITTSSPLPTGTAGVSYSQTLAATGGSTPYTWSVAAGSRPDGLNLAADGVLSGTPMVAGSFNFNARVAGADGQSATAIYNMTINPGTATVTLGDLAAVYNGSPKSATATTQPPGLPVRLTYGGATTPPTNAGSYPVEAVIEGGNFTGSATGTLVIAKGAATVTLGNLTAMCDGTPQPVAVTTIPEGLVTVVTYAGSPTPPSALGSYAVSASIDDANYTGMATGTLTLGIGPVTFSPDPALLYPNAVDVTLACATPGVQIRYTTDGSVPATGSYLATGPIHLTRSTRLRAAGFATGGGSGAVAEAMYLVGPLPVASGLKIQFDAQAIAGLADGDPVINWNDTSGNANHAISGTSGAAKPIYKAGILNGQPVVRFNPDGLSYFTFANRLTTIRTVFIVAKQNATGSWRHFLLGDSSAYHFHPGSSSQFWEGNASGHVLGGITRLNGEVINGATTSMGTSWFSLSLVTTGNVTADALGKDRQVYDGRFWDGDMAEVLIYDRALSESEVSQVEDYLNAKWFNALKTVAYPVISPAGGTHTTAVAVSLATATAGATLYYTADGSIPGEHSQVYGGPFTLGADATVRAIAYKAGFNPSGVASMTYHIDAQPPVITELAWQGAALTNGQTLTDKGTLSAVATDNEGVVSAEFYYTPSGSASPLLVGRDSTPADGLTAAWDIATIADGSYTLTVRVYDVAGAWSELSSEIQVALATPAAPVIVTPVSGLTVLDPEVPISMTAQPFANVRLYRDQTLIFSGYASASGAFGYMAALPEGSCVFKAVAVNRAGSSADSNLVTIHRVREFPVLSLTFNNNTVTEAEPVIGTVTLPAPETKDVTVQISTNKASQMAAVNPVVIAAGATSATFTLSARQDSEIELLTTLVVSASAAEHRGVETEIFLGDDDYPTLQLTIDRNSVSESHGTVVGMIRRSPVSDRALRVMIQNTNPAEAMTPEYVDIPASQAEKSFSITICDDTIDDGNQNVKLRGVVSLAGTTICQSDNVILEVRDNEGPQLTLEVTNPFLAEGQSVNALVTRSGGSNAVPLVVSLSQNPADQLTVPASVTIPAGQDHATFVIAGRDSPVSGTRSVTVGAAATDYTDGLCRLTLTDDAKAELTASGLSAPALAFTETYATVNYQINNHGSVPVAGKFFERIFLSPDPSPSADDLLVRQLESTGELVAGGAYSRNVTVLMPARTGTYYLIVTVDPGNQVPELNEDNNTSVLMQPMAVRAAYSATVRAETKLVPANTPIIFTGSATKADASPAAFAMINIHIKLNGTTRTISAVTNAMGQFGTTWQPLTNEGGLYTIGASHPGTSEIPAQDTFEILTLGFSPPAPVSLNEAETVVVEATLRNPNAKALHGLAMTVSGVPAGLRITPAMPSPTLDAGAEMKVPLTVSANTGFSGTGSFPLTVTTTEGVTMHAAMNVNISLLTPSLAFSVGSLDASVLRGGSKSVSFTISNVGGLATGPVRVMLPALPWLSLACASPLPSIPPGGSENVSILLTPDATAPLTLSTGTIAINPANGPGRSMAYQFRMVSSAMGNLAVDVVDELFFFTADAPKLKGAQVIVRDAISSAQVASMTTGGDGIGTFTGLAEGWYRIEVAAPEHDSYSGNYYVNAGQNNAKQVFISKQLVKYSWKVEEVEIEDVYRVTVETKFETNVPVPVVTATPSAIDVSDLVVLGQSKIVNITLENHGLIAAQHSAFDFSEHPFYSFTPLVANIGTIPAKSSLVVPVTVRRVGIFGDDGEIITEANGKRGTRTAKGPGGNPAVPCGAAASVKYSYPCGEWLIEKAAVLAISGVQGSCDGGGNSGLFAGYIREYYGSPAGGFYDGGGTSEAWRGGSITSDSASFISIDNTCLTTCLARSVADCALGFIPGAQGCFYGAAQCINDPSELDTCVWALAGCGLEIAKKSTIGVWVNGASCIWGFGKCYYEANKRGQPAGTKGPARAPTAGQFVLDTAFRDFAPPVAEAWSRCEPVLRMYELHFGSKDLVIAQGSEKGSLAMKEYAAATLSASPGGVVITPDESIGIEALSLDAGIGLDLVQAAIERWNRTQDYHSRDIWEIADVPNGESTDFIDRTSLRATATAIINAFDTSRAKGYLDPFDEFLVESANLKQTLQGSQGGTCATVKIQLSQDAVMTRTAFRATLVLENERTDGPVTGVGFDLQIHDDRGLPSEDLFNVQVTKLTGLAAIDGTGEIPSAATGSAQWTLIPRDTAALETTRRYTVGGVIHYVQNGSEFNIPVEDMPITVRPDAALVVKYFHQRDVLGDDPHTDAIEPSVPYKLAVLVENNGFGEARNLRIISGQPQIVDNEKGLFIDYKVIGTEVGGQPMSPSLTADFGTLAPGQKKTAIWYLTSSLQGLFTDYKATFEHVTGLGDNRISLLKEVEIHELIRMVRAQGAADDGLPDFLTNDVKDANDYPDTIHFSHGGTGLVTLRQTGTYSGAPAPGSLSITLNTGAFSGWSYIRLPDPGKGSYRLVSATRDDGRILPLDSNVWQSDRTFIGGGHMPVYEDILHLVDNDSSGVYALVYAVVAPPDSTPPSSYVNALPAQSGVSVPVNWSGTDNQTVAHFDVYVSADGAPYSLWQGHTAELGGLFAGTSGGTYRFYSIATDHAGNREPKEPVAEATTQVALLNQAPVIAAIENATVNEGESFTLQATATDPDGTSSAIRFSLTSDRAGVVIDPLTGILRWSTSEADGGAVAHVVVTATDAGLPAGVSSQSFSITVNEVNLAPTLTQVGPQTIAADGLLIIDLEAADGDLPAQTIRFALTEAPAGATIDAASGVIQWAPTSSQYGKSHGFLVTATDDGVPVRSASMNFSVTVLPSADRPPVFNKVPVVLWLKGKSYSLTVSATDPDGDPISLTANTTAAAGAVFNDLRNGNGTLSWNTTSADVGTYDVPVTATAGERSTQATVRIKVANDELYWQWAKDIFGDLPAGFDLSLMSMDADPDGDGRANLHEMAFLTNPLAMDSVPLKLDLLLSEPFSVTRLNLHRRVGADRYVEFDLGSSENLADSWQRVSRWDWDARIDGKGDDDGRTETEEMDFYLYEFYPAGIPARKFYRVESTKK